MRTPLDFLKDLTTGVDGESFDVGRSALVLAVPAYFALGFMGIAKATAEHPFDFQAFGIGFGSICIGIGGLLKLKEGTEPKAPPASDAAQ